MLMNLYNAIGVHGAFPRIGQVPTRRNLEVSPSQANDDYILPFFHYGTQSLRRLLSRH